MQADIASARPESVDATCREQACLFRLLYLRRNQTRVVGAIIDRPSAADLKLNTNKKRQLRLQISAVFSALHIDICSDHAGEQCSPLRMAFGAAQNRNSGTGKPVPYNNNVGGLRRDLQTPHQSAYG